MTKQPLILIVLDGWGYSEEKEHNAIAQAKTPFFDSLWQEYPHTLLDASQEAVGLPKGQIGNSEVGHLTIGTGRIIDVDLARINKAIAKKDYHSNFAFTQLFDHVKKYNSTLHILGLVSPGGIHSHHEHLYEFLKAAKSAGVAKIAIHAFTDGRDVPPKSASKYLKELEKILDEIQIGHIATVQGRFFAMDRDKNWDRLKKAEEAIFEYKGKICHLKKSSDVLHELYQQGIIDELLEPLVFLDENQKGWPIEENDGVFFFNFRADRARQLTQSLINKKQTHNLCLVTMTEYDKSFETLVAFPPIKIDATLAAEISRAGMKQVHIAETEKYAHVTYFFNGGREEPHKNERHILIDSRQDIKTHDQAPEMRAKEITDKTIEIINEDDTDFILVNFANADMVGHTANLPAILKALKTVDRELKRIIKAAIEKGMTVIVTADHGNAEKNIDVKTGEKHTAHTLNLVPFILVSSPTTPPFPPLLRGGLRGGGTLADIAPTILKLMQLPKPSGMTGESLIL
jgi:2,3-bisphosphoglycerate-independent phosphoglycerate mutase